jgi:hypothetical protein
MNITNEQIIQSARHQREVVDNRMDVEPWSHSHRQGRGLAAIIGIAASLVSFIAGYGLHANMSQSDIQPLAHTIQVQHDTIMQKETIRDTIYQTRTVTKTVTKHVESLTAQREPQSMESEIPSTASPAEQMACSMLCDNIPYDLLAQP